MVDMIEIALGIVAFTLIVNMMIFVILFARTRLVKLFPNRQIFIILFNFINKN